MGNTGAEGWHGKWSWCGSVLAKELDLGVERSDQVSRARKWGNHTMGRTTILRRGDVKTDSDSDRFKETLVSACTCVAHAPSIVVRDVNAIQALGLSAHLIRGLETSGNGCVGLQDKQTDVVVL